MSGRSARAARGLFVAQAEGAEHTASSSGEKIGFARKQAGSVRNSVQRKRVTRLMESDRRQAGGFPSLVRTCLHLPRVEGRRGRPTKHEAFGTPRTEGTKWAVLGSTRRLRRFGSVIGVTLDRPLAGARYYPGTRRAHPLTRVLGKSLLREWACPKKSLAPLEQPGCRSAVKLVIHVLSGSSVLSTDRPTTPTGTLMWLRQRTVG